LSEILYNLSEPSLRVEIFSNSSFGLNGFGGNYRLLYFFPFIGRRKGKKRGYSKGGTQLGFFNGRIGVLGLKTRKALRKSWGPGRKFLNFHFKPFWRF